MAQDLITADRRRRLVRLCTALTRDGATAEDLAQETLLEAWRHRDRVVDAEGVDRWLAAIARNVCRRWRRERTRAVLPLSEDVDAHDDHDLVLDLERDELATLLDRALALLPDDTRDVLVERYINETPHAVSAERLGISVDAVAMRLTRGKLVLRRVLTRELCADADGYRPTAAVWHATRVWCGACASTRLEMRRTEGQISFRCTTCSPDAPTCEVQLRNPFFRALVEGLTRPTAIIARTEQAVHRFFAPGAGARTPCTRCGAIVTLRVLSRTTGKTVLRGLYARCGVCREDVWSSELGLTLAHPRVRRFRRGRRVRAAPVREGVVGGRAALVAAFEDIASTERVEVALARDTLGTLDPAAS